MVAETENFVTLYRDPETLKQTDNIYIYSLYLDLFHGLKQFETVKQLTRLPGNSMFQNCFNVSEGETGCNRLQGLVIGTTVSMFQYFHRTPLWSCATTTDATPEDT